MALNQQPLRGLVPTIFVIIGSLIFIWVGEEIFGIDPGMLSVYALFFVWTAFVISLWDKWPFQKLKQPAVGMAFLVFTLVVGILHPFVMEWLGFGSEYYWPLISNLFLAVGLVIAFGNPLIRNTKQPKSAWFNTLAMYIFAILLIMVFGFVPAIWFAMFVFLFFWLGQWPAENSPQPVKGIMLFVIMAAFSLILEYLFEYFGTSFFQPDAGLWFVIWVWWLVLTSWQLETWPLHNVKQPLKGIGGLIITVPLTFITYYLVTSVLGLDAGIAGAYIWVFVSWLYTWDIVFGKWPAERPVDSKTEVSQETPQPEV